MWILDNLSLFSWLSEQEKSTFELFCQIRKLRKWEILFSEWDEAQAMYIVKEWSLEVFRENKILWEIKTWWFVWEMAIILDQPKTRMASAKALEDSTLVTILSFSVKELENKHPEIIEKIKKIIEKRINENKNKWI